MPEQSAAGAVIYQAQKAGWEPIPFLCHLMLSLRTAILVDKCPHPRVMWDPPWERSLTFYYASAIQTTPRVTVTADIHHISLDTNAEKINQGSSMTIRLVYLCSLLWSATRQDGLNNNFTFQLLRFLCFGKIPARKHLNLRAKICFALSFITKDVGHSICLWKQSRE